MTRRKPLDIDAYVERSLNGPCFICELVRGNPEFAHHIVHEDDDTIIFLSKYPTLRGYSLVCPKQHVEDLASDVTSRTYLDLQTHVHRLAVALKQVFEAERIYVLSLGSQQGNAHLHWHVVPLPAGTPYDQQQYHALMAENGVLDISDMEMADMAKRIGLAFNRTKSD